jgi:hypothetical protein
LFFQNKKPKFLQIFEKKWVKFLYKERKFIIGFLDWNPGKGENGKEEEIN